MREFAENFETLNGTKAKVIVKHILWGDDSYKVDKLQIVNDEQRIGVKIKGSELYMYKQNVILYKIIDDVYTISDGRMEINIIKL